MAGAWLLQANLAGAWLDWANLEQTNITPKQLKDSATFYRAKMPDGSSPVVWILKLYNEAKIDNETFITLSRLTERPKLILKVNWTSEEE